MTRLADALQRANRASSSVPAVALAPTPPLPSDGGGATTPETRVVRGRMQVPASMPSFEAGALPAGGTTLIAPPEPAKSDWRGNPELMGKLVGTAGFPAAALEQYRKLAATLHRVQEEHNLQVVMTASCLPGEGKSLTVINLALTLSDSYQRRVLLVDADLRRPTVQRVFQLATITGLDDGLKADSDRPMPLLEVADRLFVLPAGRPDPDPLSGLTSERMARLVGQARRSFDWVLIDTPPVTLLPDANLLAANVDGVLLVVRAGKAPYHLVKRTVETVGHDRILGVVMNAVDHRHDRNAGGYYEYYGYGGYGYSTKK
jgi:capsular exopolysaccharide synthesis family protein